MNKRTRARVDEYLRRNLLHAASIGIQASCDLLLIRYARLKRPPKWAILQTEVIKERIMNVAPEMARHRDEIRLTCTSPPAA